MRSGSIIRLFFVLASLAFLGFSCEASTSTPSIARVPTNIPESGSRESRSADSVSHRLLLTYNDLMNGNSSSSPIDNQALTMPEDASFPEHIFEGRLELLGEAESGNFLPIVDVYDYSDDYERAHIPEFDYEFVQDGIDLIPLHRGLIITNHPYWNYILGPGRVWQEVGDLGYSRGSFPFALVEKNANCTHNGVMTFLFNDSEVSHVYYQITQETCPYFKGNFWGILKASYIVENIPGAFAVMQNYSQEISKRITVKPFYALKDDYPEVNLKPFTSGITKKEITAYGVIYNGVHYLGGGVTRFGEYPYLESMRMPSYSLAKSIFAGGVLMRLAQKYGEDVSDLLIADYVREVANASGNWRNVTFGNALDMATGNYESTFFEHDEHSDLMDNYFIAETYTGKMDLALRWENKAPPGSIWVYHTSDTFILTQAMQAYLQKREGKNVDIFHFFVDEVLKPIGVGPGAYTLLRTKENDWHGHPLGGYGLFLIPDDLAKITTFLNVYNGCIGGEQILDPDLLAASMQHNPGDRGLDTDGYDFKYNNGFWAHQFTTKDGFLCDFWVPFMSGYGGIVVVMLPNGATFYYFSDNNEYDWYDAVAEIETNLSSNCVP
ncbi:MAG TPA: beta-lactamase family protein [Anaerolineae bacterium]|nr:beta-lactamase family protein [Anaerolineae bacterium]